MGSIIEHNYVFYTWYHYIIDYVGLFIETFLLFFLLVKTLHYKKEFIHKNIILWVSSIIGTVLFIVTGELSHNAGYIYHLLFFLLGIIFSHLFLKGKLYFTFITTMIYVSSLMSLTGFSHIFERLYTAPYLGELIPLDIFTECFFFRRILMRGILFLLVKFLIKFPLKDNSFVPKIYWRSFLILAILLQFQHYPSVFFGFILLSSFLETMATLITPLLLYYFFSSAIRHYNNNILYTMENKQLQLEQRHFTEISDLYENLRQVRHDLKNHIFTMDSLINNNNYNELKSYFSQLKGSLENLSYVDAGSYCINAVLNSKIQQARNKDITINVKASIPQELQILDLDICSVLGNLLDNAMEAIESSVMKHITIEIILVGIYLSITVTNDLEYDLIAQNPSLHTTKYDNKSHGLGISIIRKIVNKYDGMCLFTMQGNTFVGSVQLKNTMPK